MLILAKSILVLLSGFILSVITGIFLIPILRKLKANQSLSVYLENEHRGKVGTPTIGGLIFIIPTLLLTFLLLFFDKIHLSYNLIIVLFTFTSYALIGFIDDYLIIKNRNNKGLSVNQKFFLQFIVAVIFFYFFMKGGNEPLLWIQTLNIKYSVGFIYGFIILIILVSSSNAVNITDGLDGLAGGLSVIAFLAFSIICWSADWLDGYQDIALFGFTLVGALLGFLMFNSSPAKVFMGDTGSLCLGATLGCCSIITRHELVLVIIGIVFVIETVTCILQIGYYKITHKRLFPMTPIHHTFERMGYNEKNIVKFFWIIGVIGAILSLIFVFCL